MSEMKIPCAVAEDLLPLYHDAVCSEESRTLVEEHIKECAHCAAILRTLQGETETAEVEIDDAAALKSIEKEWKKGKAKSKFNRIVSLGITLLFAFSLCIYGLDQWKVLPVSADVMEISERYQLSDGRIIYHLNVTDGKDFHFNLTRTDGADGSHYITLLRSPVEGKRAAVDSVFNDYFILDVSGKNEEFQDNGTDIVITRCYLGTEDDNILLWEEGMELPAASAEMERMVKAGEVTD